MQDPRLFPVSAQVQVLWPEAQEYYPATIEAVHQQAPGAVRYDVCYVQKVNNKDVVENGVEAWRVIPPPKEAVPTNRGKNPAHERMKEAETVLVGSGKNDEPEPTSVPMVIEGERDAPAFEEAQDCEEADLLASLEDLLSPFTPDSMLEERAQAAAAICNDDICSSLLQAFKVAHSNEPLRLKIMLFASALTWQQMQRDLSWNAVVIQDKPFLRALRLATGLLEQVVARDGNYTILPSESLLVPLQFVARLVSITFAATHQATQEADEDVPGKPATRARTRVGAAARKKLDSSVMRIFTHISALFDVVSELHRARRLEDTTIIASYEAALEAFSLDATTASSSKVAAALADGEQSLQLRRLHGSAAALLQVLFQRYDSFRRTLILELLSTMSHTCGSKKTARTFPLHFGENALGPREQFIHRTTAVLLHFLHSATNSSAVVSDSQQEPDASFEGMLENCRKCAKFFLGNLFQRAQIKESGAAYKQVIEHLLADVLACMQHPDWPAAEIVLSSLSSILVSSVQVLDPRSNADIDRKDMVWHNFLLELLASTTTSLWKAIPQAPPSAATSFPASLAADIQARCEDTMSKLAAAASVPEEATASAELRRIDRILHFKAVVAVQVMEFQFLAMNEDGAPLFQQTLTAPDANQVLEIVDVNLHTRWRECAGASDIVSRVDNKYQILLEVLTSRSKEQPSEWVDVISLHRLLWHEHLKHQNNEPMVRLLADSMHMDHMKTSCSDLSWRATAQSELIQAVMQELLLEKTVRTLADRLLNATLLLVAQESPTIRAKIVKGLSSILAVSPHLMAKEEVRTCVVERFNDVAISVRQAAVDLVGSFVTSSGHALVVTHYLDALLDRLRDVGVSVRKSVVKICRDILLHYPGHPRAMDICHQLVERSAVVKEEDTIRDTIRDTFYRIWLSPTSVLGSTEPCATLGSLMLDSPSHHPISAVDSESLLLKTPSTAGQITDAMTTPFSGDRTDDSRSASDDLEARSIVVAKQLVDVVQSVASPQWMVRLFRDLLSCRADGADTKKADELKLVEAVAQCQRVVDVLIHAFLLLERTGTNVVGSWRMNKAWEDDMQGIMSTLAVFSEVQPSLLAGYLHILLPLLKADNGLANEGAFCLLVADIVARTVRLSTTAHQLTMNEALTDLGRLCTKYEPPVVNGAMACMAHIIHAVAHDASKYLSLAQLCYSRVLALLQHLQAGRSMDDSQIISFLPRCLLVLGSACRHLPLIDHIVSSKSSNSNQAENTPTFMDLEELPQTLTAASIYPQCYSLFVHTMTAVDDFRIQARAATALCGAFSACPQLMYHADTSGLLSKFLGGVFGDTVRLHVLQSLQEVMRAGEEIIGMDQAAIREAADQVHGGRCEDASIAGAVLQEYVPLFLQLLVDKDAEVKIEALALLGILLQQGMVCPHDVLPGLFALQGDDNELLRAESLRLIQVEDERRPGHLAAHCASGVCLAAQQAASAPQNTTGALRKVAKYIKRTPTSEPDLIHQIQSIFAPAYASCLQSSRQTRTTFLNTVLKKCKEMLLSVSDAAHQKPRKTFQRASTAHALPAATRVAWVSFVVQTIAHLPYIAEDEVLMVIWWINRHTMLEASQVCTALASELQRRGVDLSMEEGLETSFTANSAQLTADLATLVADALCLSSMHRLKHFLKTSFKLSTDKCLAFNPQAKCSDKQVVLSELVFEPVLSEALISDLDAADLGTSAWTDKIEDIFQQLVGDALETTDDMGVLGGKRKAKKVAAPAAPAKAVVRRRGKPTKRRKVQKMTGFDSESDESLGGSDESEYEP